MISQCRFATHILCQNRLDGINVHEVFFGCVVAATIELLKELYGELEVFVIFGPLAAAQEDGERENSSSREDVLSVEVVESCDGAVGPCAFEELQRLAGAAYASGGE